MLSFASDYIAGAHPEIMKRLVETGLEIVDHGAWFYAHYQGQDTAHAIAFRADYDAVVCQDGCARHLCGHDGHSAILAGSQPLQQSDR